MKNLWAVGSGYAGAMVLEAILSPKITLSWFLFQLLGLALVIGLVVYLRKKTNSQGV